MSNNLNLDAFTIQELKNVMLCIKLGVIESESLTTEQKIRVEEFIDALLDAAAKKSLTDKIALN